jgi:Domain of unknown function (DUF4389)
MTTSVPPISSVGVAPDYPVTFRVDYPDRPLNRLTTFFRPIVAIPILVVLGLIAGGTYQFESDAGATVVATGGGLLVLPTVLMIVIRRKYPRWWFEFNRELARFVARVYSYLVLLDDRYPSTDDEQAVHFELPYPDVERDLNRWLPLVKWLLAIPHYIVLFFLWIAAAFVVIFAWFAILFTGRYPQGAFDFVVGVARWQARVAGYATLLVTDRYPPFSLH